MNDGWVRSAAPHKCPLPDDWSSKGRGSLWCCPTCWRVWIVESSRPAAVMRPVDSGDVAPWVFGLLALLVVLIFVAAVLS